MKIGKSILKSLFWLVILALLLSPLGLILRISQAEMKQYATPSAPVLQQTSFGSVVQATRMDMREYVTVSGIVGSDTYVYLPLEYDVVQDIRWYVAVGDEIQNGQLLASGPYGEVISSATGILQAFHLGSQADCYLKVQQFSPVTLECQVSDTVLSMLKRSNALCTAEGVAVEITFVSAQKNANGTTNIRFAIESQDYTFGEHVQGLVIYTGRVFQNTVVLPINCVYQKKNSSGWYARKVNADGIFVAEIPVELGYSDGVHVCVTGVNAGDFFDSGYQLIAQG